MTAEEQDGRDHAARFDDKHHRIAHHPARVQLNGGIPNRATDDFPFPNCFRSRHKSPQNVLPAPISKCSRIGPRLKAGKKVSAPTITITPMSKTVNRGVVTGKVPTD